MLKRIIIFIVSTFLTLTGLSISVNADDNQNSGNLMFSNESEESEKLPPKNQFDNSIDDQVRSSNGIAYAVITDDKELVFFRSNNFYEHDTTGTFVDINGNEYTGNIMAGVEDLPQNRRYPFFNDYVRRSSFVRVRCAEGQVIKPVDMSNWFVYCKDLISVDLSGIDTTNVKDMNSMFEGCESLVSVNLNNWNTSNVTNMTRMFFNCKSLKSLDISSFDTSKVQYMSNMFSVCKWLYKVNLGSRFVVWKDNAYLPDGSWTHSSTNMKLTNTDLYHKFPQNPKEFSGLWERRDDPLSININPSKVSVEINKQAILSPVLEPANVINDSVKWLSADEKIAIVDANGRVTGKSSGKTKITAVTANGLTSECDVLVLFNDVASKSLYYYDPVYWMFEHEITKGYKDPDGLVRTFKPQNKCTREAVVTFLWRLHGKPDPKTTGSPFSDVTDESKYYYKAVLWAYEKGIANGYSDNTFRPNDICLREHVVTFLWRYAGEPNPQAWKNPFNDLKPTDYYYRATIWANENGIAKGYKTGAHAGGFGPKLDCLREHVVTFLYRYIEYKISTNQ